MSRFFEWWYQLTSIPEPVEEFTPGMYEQVRRSRLLSTIVLSLLVIFLMFVPACLALPNHYVILVDIAMMPLCLVALIFNRLRHTYLAGVLLVVSFEAALNLVILTTQPFDEPSLQQYELFVFGELLAVSLLNARSVFLVAILNSTFIGMSLVYQEPKTAMLLQDLQTQFLPLLLRPIAVQLLVAGVTYLWVSNATTHMTLAYQAKMTALAAQRVAEEQKEREKQERLGLQEHIERVVHIHAAAMNTHSTTKIPISEYEPVLWPLINVFNSLQNRLQHANQVENELQQLHDCIASCTELIYQNTFSLQRPMQTRTALDPFFLALRDQQYLQTRRTHSMSTPFREAVEDQDKLMY
ncbi:hypothetical protein KSF_006310 [Reticulibacter mediterranei]|uniref:Uncharacterized protein n=1 Tax=Reticulibacter mediterranei TaxID=2778369 RepID=A0A8J3IDI6_9CHLR|nr:hypothetical protein [Reticulibacter mediterranei]GHO90583.1 hypothetical protein KSF_006310 [Reticulibacter mediterranei]